MADIDRLIEAAKVIQTEVTMEEPSPVEPLPAKVVTIEAKNAKDDAIEAVATEEAAEEPAATEVINLDSPTSAAPRANKRK
ncbi:unnamed protein product [Calypogeia fissa]